MTLRKSLALLFALAIAVAAIVGYTLGRQGAPAGHATQEPAGNSKEEKEATAITAKVKVAPARNGVIEQLATAFGTVVASPEDIQSISVPFESRVRRVLVVAGQAVNADTKLIEVEPSPEALLALSDARTTKAAAERDLAQVQQRVDLKLATMSELSTAQQTLQLAQSKLDSLEKRGIELKRVPAGSSVVVSKIDMQEGQIVSAGGTLMEVVPANRIQVKLGVDPSQALQVRPGQNVHIETVQNGPRIKVDGVVKMVTQRINPASRLVDVLVDLPAKSPLMLDSFVRAMIVVNRKDALVVPRSAVLTEEGKQIMFTVADGKAMEHEVETGLEDEDNVELLSGVVKPGDTVVVLGNAELETGMTVEVEEAHSTSTQGASQPGSAASRDNS